MSINKKWILLFPVLFLLGIFIGKHFAHRGLRRSLQEAHQKNLSLNGQLQSEVYLNIAAKCAIAEIYSDVKSGSDRVDSADLMTELIYERYCPASPVIPKVANVERKQSWEKTLEDLNSELFFCHNWFDSVAILSSWVYQNTRVGDTHKYDIKRVIGEFDNLSHFDIKQLYEAMNSDSVVSDCGFHCYYALLLYNYFGIKSYCFSIRQNHKNSTEGHMFNVLQNPHDHKWYPIDNFFGLRYNYNGAWLDIEKYFLLSKEQFSEINVEAFGTFKFHIQDSPFVECDSWDMDNIEIVTAEVSNYRNHFRIVAPYTLRKQFPHLKSLFDSIAASYNQPPHDDWIDLAKRMPLYGARLFSPLNFEEQTYADSLFTSWIRQQLVP